MIRTDKLYKEIQLLNTISYYDRDGLNVIYMNVLKDYVVYLKKYIGTPKRDAPDYILDNIFVSTVHNCIRTKYISSGGSYYRMLL